MNDDEIPMFMASNEPPPPAMLYSGEDTIFSCSEAEKYSEDMRNWKQVTFAFSKRVGGTVSEFIPLLVSDSDKRIENYNYIVRCITTIKKPK